MSSLQALVDRSAIEYSWCSHLRLSLIQSRYGKSQDTGKEVVAEALAVLTGQDGVLSRTGAAT